MNISHIGKLTKWLQRLVAIAVAFLLCLSINVRVVAASEELTPFKKPASEFTKAKYERVLKNLDFNRTGDYERVRRGLIHKPEEPPLIKDSDGHVVWDLTKYGFLNEENPLYTVNPSLKRQAQLNMDYGLYKVKERRDEEGKVVGGIYQVRGYDLAVMTVITSHTKEGKPGWIVIDPLTAEETAKEAMRLVREYLGPYPVTSIIHTHSHVDHFAGIEGILRTPKEKTETPIYAPKGYLDAAVSENVLAENTMGRRSTYMYGNLLPKEPQGQVDAGLGKGVSNGTPSLLKPTDPVEGITGEIRRKIIDGVEFQFVNVPESEAPEEMIFYLPQFKALCSAEDATHNLHNVYTLRGAKVRDSLAWSNYLGEMIKRFGDKTDVLFASHQWPTWGNEEVIALLTSQRDMYKYLHDQTLNLANQGYTMLEIAERVKLPDSLAKEWYNRPYYGTVNHNVKAIYQRYFGWFDGNPSNLDKLPPQEAAKKYVEYMGGADKALTRAKKDYNKGEYRWVAEAMSHLVFADPRNCEARFLEADALEQMGYQAESGPWRNIFLTGAQELREGVRKRGYQPPKGEHILPAVPTEYLLDYLAERIDGNKAATLKRTFTIDMTFINKKDESNNEDESKDHYVLYLENGVLTYIKLFGAERVNDPDSRVQIDRTKLDKVLATEPVCDILDTQDGLSKCDKLIEVLAALESISVSDNRVAFLEFIDALKQSAVKFDPWFNIVLPHNAIREPAVWCYKK